MILSTALFVVLYHGFEGTEGLTGFPNVGTWLIFGVVLLPVYVMVIAWFVGTPRESTAGVRGVGYLVGITVTMWVSMLILTILIGISFFGGSPEPFSSPGP
ncbi:hypothetical protein EA462_06420 [Natrarchaeobius halalkaliphilus]|uniref:Yip1 domain-containing protein n=1 Tax=Natrarchaeobius halalkaliphilus TaxID=1679091 RepID=A0A3N6LPX2_9EURY|nr:hypothetical protein [Natrarchaeobius halalkaliphilus]RQG91583.1 hypothetical protein EA462_06420 [Natrarchaeobius halalkaliphilus]